MSLSSAQDLQALTPEAQLDESLKTLKSLSSQEKEENTNSLKSKLADKENQWAIHVAELRGERGLRAALAKRHDTLIDACNAAINSQGSKAELIDHLTDTLNCSRKITNIMPEKIKIFQDCIERKKSLWTDIDCHIVGRLEVIKKIKVQLTPILESHSNKAELEAVATDLDSLLKKLETFKQENDEKIGALQQYDCEHLALHQRIKQEDTLYYKKTEKNLEKITNSKSNPKDLKDNALKLKKDYEKLADNKTAWEEERKDLMEKKEPLCKQIENEQAEFKKLCQNIETKREALAKLLSPPASVLHESLTEMA